MATEIYQITSPWEAASEQVMAAMTELVPCDRVLLSFTPQDSPATHVLFVAGIAAEPATELAQHEVVHPDPSGTWRLTMARRGAAFSERERMLGRILLQHWHCRFMQPAELRMGRLLLREDCSVVAYDLAAQAWRLDEQVLFEPLLKKLDAVLRQRFVNLDSDQTYEAIIGDQQKPIWVKLRFQRPGSPDGERYGCVEMRMLDPEEAPVIDEVEDDRVARSIGHIDRHYAEAPDLAQTARVARMSPFHFHRIFSSQAGVSPKQYVLARQLQVARWLLRTKDTPIAEVASRCGFSSHGHFTATFRRLTGMKPSVFRDRQHFSLWQDARLRR